jgi:hypothetical protein
MIRALAASAVLFVLTGCDKPGPPAEAQRIAAVLTGDAKGSPDANPVCKLFTAAEASVFSGKKLQAGSNAAMGTGCQWAADDDAGGMTMVQVVAKGNAPNPSGAPGFRELRDLGAGAFVAEDMGGWVAGAPQGPDFIAVVVTGPKASAQTAIELVKATLKRRQ